MQNNSPSPSRAFTDDALSYPDPFKIAAQDDPTMPHLEDIYASPSEGIFIDSSYDADGVVTDFNNLEITVNVNPTPITRIHTIHPKTQILGDPSSVVQIKRKVNKNSKAHALKSWCDEFEELMKNRFQMSSMGELTFFLGLQVKQKEDGIFISQDKYVAEILKKFNFLSVKTASTPIETQKPLVKDEEAADVDVHLYRSMIGSLMYLTTSRYLKGKPKLGLWYPKVSSFDLEAYLDTDYAGANLGRKSTTGGCQFLCRRLISWQSKKHTIVATSTIKAKYVAAAHCCGQVLWIQNQLLDYGFNLMNTKIYIDNSSTVCIVKNPVFHSKTKHIKTRHHFIRDAYEKKLIQFTMSNTRQELASPEANGFCKELANPKQTALGVNTPRYDEDSVELKELMVFFVPICVEKDGVGVNAAKPTESEGFKQIIDFLDGSSVKYALTASLTIRTSCIKQFWSTAKVKTVNDEARVHALIDAKRVSIKESSIRRTLKLDDEEGTSCLANDEIFTGLANMGYEKISDKLTFYKAFFSPQWKFLMHTILQCLSAKTTSSNEFSSTMASTIICLATNQKFNFSRYILLSLVKNIEAGVPFYMFPRFVQLIVDHQLEDMSHHQDIYDNPSLTKKVFANMKRVGTGFSRVITPLFENMLVPAAEEVGQAQDDVSIPTEPSTSKPHKKHKLKKQQPIAPKVPSPEPSPEHQLPSPSNDPIPTAKDSLKLQELIDICIRLSNKVLDLESKVIDIKSSFTDKIEKLKSKVHKLEKENRILKEKSFKSAKIDIIAPVEDKEESFKHGMMIADMDEDVEVNLEEAHARKNMMICLKNMAGFKMNFFKGMTYREIRPLFEKHYNSNQAFLEKVEEEVTVQENEIEEKGNKRQGESLEQEIAKKQRMDEEAEELKRHLQIMSNDDDDVYIEVTPLASKVPVVDYQIHHENNKPYYKIIRADGSHKLFFSFITLLKNFDREDLETLWKLVKERFETTEPKNFSDDFLLNILKIMFEKPNIEANVWKDQKGRYGLEVEEESEMSLGLPRLVRRQLNEGGGSASGYISDFESEDLRRKLQAGTSAYEGKTQKELVMMEFKEMEFLTLDVISCRNLKRALSEKDKKKSLQHMLKSDQTII
nr:putative ribonuclease H-like domain-containing protein [Tanacetum cinerariifolium]